MTVNIDQLNTKMTEWLSAFKSHPQLQPPSPQPTLFFMYEFARNTHSMLEKIDADKYRASDPGALAQMKEVTGRNMFAKVLLNDTTGKLGAMTGGGTVDFGEEVKGKADAVNAVGA
ncbi:hypothetical protein P170DRAFT_507203 [Aspergillus steynii IBT 23096]|uniref:Uncharacterized protein n=1 Tax=Aspergillus steynii IBT 23096 TaxID=1392250 RepID=A0A2I2GHP8_9EURO|nr:uncharacterized protein P170DRAFT_507203 [Aspergillus steynii IBT 23096]PLB52405.1 hypothetical protein P170DRAFT_507203 [Aspergillus steynii IBT 23096]